VKLLPADTPLDRVAWIPRSRLPNLARLGIRSLADLLHHFPRRHENRSTFSRFPDFETPEPVTLCGTIGKVTARFAGSNRKIIEADLWEDREQILARNIRLRWFNAHFVQKMLSEGDRVVVHGKVRLRSRLPVMEHPDFEVIEEDAGPSIHFGRIVPVHPAGEGITPKALRTWIFHALEQTDPVTLAPLLPATCPEHDGYAAALRTMHFPESMEVLAAAREAIVLEEFFRVQAVLVSRRQEIRSLPGSAKLSAGNLARELRAVLPFSLTDAQEKALSEILADLRAPTPMCRLLQGDVGSGKTIVALFAALEAIEAGYEAALMAPTQILATQHFQTFQKLLAPLRIPLRLRTSGRSEDTPDPLFARPGCPAITIGTHALLYEGTTFEKLGLVIVDEQHKFGVMQRARLIRRGKAPDLLVMTATPLPRTISQTVHGDLDVSVLREKPAGRGRVITAVRGSKKLPEITAFLRERLAENRQAYIVYPLIEESDSSALKAAVSEGAKWSAALSPHRVEILHGRTPPEEKEAIINRFRSGQTAVLVSTTVIEVGVDVPNATVLLVENAERFGLAQLHQLRGRIGRGAHKSYCILVTSTPDPLPGDRLEILEKTNDGFEIAEYDLQLRGPGDLIGTAQSGLPPLRVGDLLRDAHLMTRARKLALDLFQADLLLASPSSCRLRAFLESQRAAADVSGI
jgi:ATP-dependent DNA helicase RecG